MACKNIGKCDYHISEFVYEKACTGDLKLVYCPLLKVGSNFKTPREWRSIQTSVVLPTSDETQDPNQKVIK